MSLIGHRMLFLPDSMIFENYSNAINENENENEIEETMVETPAWSARLKAPRPVQLAHKSCKCSGYGTYAVYDKSAKSWVKPVKSKKDSDCTICRSTMEQVVSCKVEKIVEKLRSEIRAADRAARELLDNSLSLIYEAIEKDYAASIAANVVIGQAVNQAEDHQETQAQPVFPLVYTKKEWSAQQRQQRVQANEHAQTIHNQNRQGKQQANHVQIMHDQNVQAKKELDAEVNKERSLRRTNARHARSRATSSKQQEAALKEFNRQQAEKKQREREAHRDANRLDPENLTEEDLSYLRTRAFVANKKEEIDWTNGVKTVNSPTDLSTHSKSARQENPKKNLKTMSLSLFLADDTDNQSFPNKKAEVVSKDTKKPTVSVSIVETEVTVQPEPPVLVPTPPGKGSKSKTQLCISVTSLGAKCPHGDRCNYAHSAEELNIRSCMNQDRCWYIVQTPQGYKNNPKTKMCCFLHPGESKENHAKRTGFNIVTVQQKKSVPCAVVEKPLPDPPEPPEAACLVCTPDPEPEPDPYPKLQVVYKSNTETEEQSQVKPVFKPPEVSAENIWTPAKVKSLFKIKSLIDEKLCPIPEEKCKSTEVISVKSTLRLPETPIINAWTLPKVKDLFKTNSTNNPQMDTPEAESKEESVEATPEKSVEEVPQPSEPQVESPPETSNFTPKTPKKFYAGLEHPPKAEELPLPVILLQKNTKKKVAPDPLPFAVPPEKTEPLRVGVSKDMAFLTFQMLVKSGCKNIHIEILD